MIGMLASSTSLYKYAGIAIAGLLLVGGAYYYYNDTQERIANLTADNAKLIQVQGTNLATIDQLHADIGAGIAAQKELEAKLRKAETYGNALEKKLRKHDLSNLALKKPGLIEKRINDATEKLISDLNSSTAD